MTVAASTSPSARTDAPPDMPDIVQYIRTIDDHPSPGIRFRDISTLLGDPVGLKSAVFGLCAAFPQSRPDKVAGIEARGFILGGAVAHELGAGFIPLRKKGKLPAETLEISYDLEYGNAQMEIHVDAVAQGEKILLVDDLIATGGTALAAIQLLRNLDADIVGVGAVIDLPPLGGSAKLRKAGVPLRVLCEFCD